MNALVKFRQLMGVNTGSVSHKVTGELPLRQAATAGAEQLLSMCNAQDCRGYALWLHKAIGKKM